MALLPNLLPIAVVGAALTLTGRGLEFSSGIALTIAFGLAIDDTAHALNRLRLGCGPALPGNPATIRRAMHEVAPALAITSAVLSFGLIGTQFAQLPSVAWFGALSIAVFVLALLADLIVLPACLVAIAGKRGGRS